MQHLMQPTGNTCGHTCVAMVAGVSVERVIELLGNHKLFPLALRNALSSLGWQMDSRSCCKVPELPECTAIGFLQKVQNYKLIGHYVVFDADSRYILDPHGDKYVGLTGEWCGRWYACRPLT